MLPLVVVLFLSSVVAGGTDSHCREVNYFFDTFADAKLVPANDSNYFSRTRAYAEYVLGTHYWTRTYSVSGAQFLPGTISEDLIVEGIPMPDGTNFLVQGDPIYPYCFWSSTYSVIVKVAVEEGNAGGGLFIKWVDGDNWLRVQVNAAGVEVEKRAGGSNHSADLTVTYAQQPPSLSGDYEFRGGATSHSVYINGTLYFSFQDNQQWPPGTLGLYFDSYGSYGKVRFDDFAACSGYWPCHLP